MEPTNFRTPDRWNSVTVPPHVAERAYTRHSVDENGCWISTYSVGSHGYAQIGWSVPAAERTVGRSKNRMVLAHRASWAHVNGQVPMGLTIDHTCKTRRCVNPTHMRLLPNYENARRTSGRDWPIGYCPNGHPNSELTHQSRGPGKPPLLTCGVCAADSRRRYQERKTGRPVTARTSRAPRIPKVPRVPKTHCVNGHEFTEGNTSWKEGARRCLTCHREQQRARRARRPA